MFWVTMMARHRPLTIYDGKRVSVNDDSGSHGCIVVRPNETLLHRMLIQEAQEFLSGHDAPLPLAASSTDVKTHSHGICVEIENQACGRSRLVLSKRRGLLRCLLCTSRAGVAH